MCLFLERLTQLFWCRCSTLRCVRNVCGEATGQNRCAELGEPLLFRCVDKYVSRSSDFAGDDVLQKMVLRPVSVAPCPRSPPNRASVVP
jgi:hypothetical protein